MLPSPDEFVRELPSRYQGAAFSQYQPTTASARKALEQARAFVAGDLTNLVLVGPPGVGKSHLAAAICNALWARDRDHFTAIIERREAEVAAVLEAVRPAWLEQRESLGYPDRESIPSTFVREHGGNDRPSYPVRPSQPLWQNVPTLVVGMRADMGRDHNSREWTDRPGLLGRSDDVVVLDDLGREKITDFTGETIYTLINARYEEMLPTVATSNLTPAELEASGYWPAISRLAEDGALIRIEAPDHRLGKKAAA